MTFEEWLERESQKIAQVFQSNAWTWMVPHGGELEVPDAGRIARLIRSHLETMDALGWSSCESGRILTTRFEDGSVYIKVLAYEDAWWEGKE